MRYTGANGELFQITEVKEVNCNVLKQTGKDELSILWFTTNDNHLIIDSQEYIFNANDVIFLTEFNKVEVLLVNSLQLLRFNKDFYCVLDHDSEVGCKGILFYGATALPQIKLALPDIEILQSVWKVAKMEIQYKDELQLEMLQMMLKRILILCTRIFKMQNNYQKTDNNIDIIREFNYLVEKHFREKHSVLDYASMLHKSPKTLSNIFKKVGNKTPLRFIQDRLTLEARRLLVYSSKSVSEIGHELGFNDIQSFSRFFKKNQGISPSEFRQVKNIF